MKDPVKIAILFAMAFSSACIAAYGTSVVHDVMAKRWVMGAVDLIVGPIGIVHGFGIWLGYWQ